MCEFCEKEKPIISSLKQFHDRIETVVCGISGNKLKCSTIVQTAIQITPPALAEIEIDFCPKCGRKLSEDTKMSEWVARYQQEPLQVIDCNMCEHISITEAEQRKRGNQHPHICQCYGKQCKHNYMERGAVFIYPCEECVADKHKNFKWVDR